MNNYTAAIASFIRFNVVILNTLEYVMKKPSYDAEAYKMRKKVIEQEISMSTPLKNCLDNSGEPGTKLTTMIKDLVEIVYGDSSTIVKVGPEGLRVDHAQHLAIFELIIPIHEEIRRIIDAHVNAAKKANAFDEESYLKLIEADEYFYRGLINMILIDELDHLFAEYNKARQEANGQVTPQSNFIQNDITKIVGLLRFVRDTAVAKSYEYYELIDPEFALIEMTGGRRLVPEGKSFGQVFNEVKTLAKERAIKWENAWKQLYDEFNNEFPEKIRLFQERAQNQMAAKSEEANKA